MQHQGPAVRATLFGQLAVDVGGRRLGPRDFGGVKPKQIFEILLLARGQTVAKDRLADQIWPESLPENVSATLETYISVLRRHLDPRGQLGRRLVVTEREAYRLAADQVELDLDRFDALLGPGGSRAPRARLEEALGLAHGDVLEDEPFADWAEAVRSEYGERVAQVRLSAGEAALASGDFGRAVVHAERVLAHEPCDERGCRLAMLSLYGLGRSSDALRAFERWRRASAEELGLEPTAQTTELVRAIRRQDSVETLLPRRTVERDAAPPRRASLPLLGRGNELARLEALVESAFANERFVCALIEGEPGAGKTRLLDEVVGRFTDVRIGRATCSEVESTLPYVPLASAVRPLLGDLDDEDLLALSRILPELARGRRAREIPQVRTLEVLAAALRERSPVLLALDDLQWVDAGTIAALGYVARRCSDAAVAVLGTVRSEEAALARALGSLRADAVVRLGPLSAAELAEVDIPDVHARTGGNPRLLAELIGADDGQARTLADLALSCRREGELAHRLLATASALKQPFDGELVAALVERDAVEVLEELERLCRRGMLVFGPSGFRFRSGLLHEAVAGSVSPARKTLLRARAAELMRLAAWASDPSEDAVEATQGLAEVTQLHDGATRRRGGRATLLTSTS